MTAPLYGLVIAGGYSRRMGRDKARIVYHELPQVLWTAALLSQVCKAVFVSCREDQDLGYQQEEGPPRIHDLFDSQGPISGLMAAHAKDPHAAWLAVACDMPRLTNEILKHLVLHRVPAMLATAFPCYEKGGIEPLCTIYEPEIMRLLEESFLQDCRCPRKFLSQCAARIHLIDMPERSALDNVNTPQEEGVFRRELR